MKKLILPLLAVAAAAPLAACHKNQPQVVDPRGPDPQAAALQNAAKVELPPAISSSVTFRCSDNTLAFVDFFQGGKQINFSTDKSEPPTHLTSDTDGGPWANDTLKVSGTTKKITYTKGDKSLTCKA
ncbi:hypothetical protein FHR23_000298 [Stakelama sediminis]|uniref:C-type lysozyme inhibitor domain-containing protein n=1 Tax=Stakelama sediminis TaxID=463200 RepID=A0A840YUQ1_9SPHN|nr:hypothetical protein [Stakelama sediminis]MBB5717391.1 hypothetical protein [Stakelama sediminis]